MKKLLHLLLVLMLVVVLASCKKKEGKAGDFTLEIRAYGSATQAIDGELLGSYKIEYDDSCIYVSDALKAQNDNKYYLSNTDYLTIRSGDFGAYFESCFIGSYSENIIDLSWGYSAYNGGYSSGLSFDKLEGLTTYTIVIDGWK